MPRFVRAPCTLLPAIAICMLAGPARAAAQPPGSRLSFSAAYFGELLLHPGAIAGAE